MGSQVNTRTLWVFLVAGIGLVAAFNAGNWIADENFMPIAIVLGFLTITLCFFGLGSFSFLLIPICNGLTGQISVLPLPFTVHQLSIILACAVFFSSIIFKSMRGKMKWEMIDLLAFINIAYLGTVFLRNPVGINALGGNLVGGKPYVDFALGVMSYVILSGKTITPSQGRLVLQWNVALIVIVGFVSTLVMFIPSLGLILGKFYSSFSNFGIADNNQAVEVGETRLTALQITGMALILFCVSFVNPARLLRPSNIKYSFMYLVGVIFILLSGFRSAIAITIALTAASMIIREKTVAVFKLLFVVLFIGAIFTAISYTGIQLPLTAQRALSFLPGDWDPKSVRIAQESTEWRHEMWRIVMTSDRYIRNKTLGDGYGFLRTDFEDMIDAHYGIGPLAGSEGDKETHMLQGTVHSGPISAIKRVGYVGLVFFLIFTSALSMYALKTIRKVSGGPFECVTYFYGLSLLVYVPIFILIFGDYNDFLTELFGLGMLKMISSSNELYKSSHSTTFA